VGLYFSSNIISIHVMEIFMYFIELFKDKKNRSILVTPLVMLVDPTMQNNRMSIKVSNFLCPILGYLISSLLMFSGLVFN